MWMNKEKGNIINEAAHRARIRHTLCLHVVTRKYYLNENEGIFQEDQNYNPITTPEKIISPRLV